MKRTLLMTPLLLATMASFGAHAADTGRLSRLGSGSGLLGVNTDSNRTALFARNRESTSSGFAARLNRDTSGSRSLSADRSSSRPLLAGLSRSDAGDRSLADRLPKISSSRDSGDGKFSQTLTIDGNNASLAISNGVERSGQTLSERLRQIGSGETRSLDSGLKLTSSVKVTTSRDSGGDNNALGLGRERSSDRSYEQSSTLNLGREGSATPARDGNKSSRDVTRTISSSNTFSSSLDRSVAPLTDAGETRNTSRAIDTRYGFKYSAGSQREGLTVTDRQRSFEPNFKIESDG
ncbi:hypothetical protein [Hydrocarboniphaga sp.]|uniref:hypothetical protein n=1 Tax=Hydrocarboniphaga sp. TaxID=2033016 RepID=UPI003D0D6150